MSEALRALARFLPAFEAPDFRVGDWAGMEEVEPGVRTMPYVRYSDVVEDFFHAACKHGWVRSHFDWGAWKNTDEAKALRDDEAMLAAATPEQLARMLTTVIRQDRFVEGALLGAFETGMILGIVRRAAALLAANEGP